MDKYKDIRAEKNVCNWTQHIDNNYLMFMKWKLELSENSGKQKEKVVEKGS